MARYIEIKEAVRVVDMCFFIQGICDDKLKNTICNSIEKNSNAIEDVAPIPHAHWERHFKRPGVYEDLWLYCTNCNSRTSEEYAPYWWSYCPYCGAKMDEKEGNI